MTDAAKQEVELIKRCQQGDSIAFERLIVSHYDTVYRFAYRWCDDQPNAQDITQISCIKLAKNIKLFRFESSFTSWLYQLVINCAKDYYKSPSQHNIREEQHDNLEQASNYSQDSSASRIYAHQILEHINQLQGDLRDALILVYARGMSHKQAADQLNIKESTVSWRVHEARKLLKQTFSSTGLESNSVAQEVRGLT